MYQSRPKILKVLLAVLIPALWLPSPGQAAGSSPNYRLERSAFSAGAGVLVSPGQRLRHVIGQTSPAGRSGSAGYLLNGGFWSPAVAPGRGILADVDGNGAGDGLTDGVLITRFLLGLREQALIDGAVATDCTLCEWEDIQEYLQAFVPTADVDANLAADGRTDGILITRYLLGLRGEALIHGAVAGDCTLCGVDRIEPYLQLLAP